MKFSPDSRVAEQQMHAVIFYLTAFGYIDGDFDDSEKAFIRDYVGKLVEQRARDALGDDLGEHRDTIARWTAHFLEVFEMVDAEIQGHFTESVAEGEDTAQFVLARLKLRCFELFKQFDEENRAALLATVDVLMMADGVVHPSEQQFRDEALALLSAPIELDDLEIETVEEGSVVIAPPTKLGLREMDHPFFKRGEVDYAKDPITFAKQAELDLALVHKFENVLDEQRVRGRGKLAGPKNFGAFAGKEPFLDQHVYVIPPKPGQAYDLLVLGDFPGCYSSLTAALMH